MDIDFVLPSKNGFTIYSKSGCPNCTNVKKLLQENKIEYLLIDCDEYLIEEREKFIEFITELVGKEVNMFPVVFFDEKFIGGCKETKEYIDRMLVDFNF